MMFALNYDFEIIKSIPFNILYPDVIIFENCHFSKDLARECNEFLSLKGYHIEDDKYDTIAVLKK